jgi:succinoglycan biosynthesis protein ExoM
VDGAGHIRAAVAVLTYNRPDELAELLGALERLMDPPGGGRLSVFVVDNDAERSAASVVELAATRSRHTLTYVSEPRPGIALARNAALHAVRQEGCDAVAFIDDDEVPEPDWLLGLVRACEEYRADGVAGPVLTTFERPPTRGLLQSGVYCRERHPSGTHVPMAATNNLLLRMNAIDSLPLPAFDVDRFNLTGGEDSDLTYRLTRSGRTLVWADDAVVREVVPADRINWRWALRRAYRTGNTAGRLFIGPGASPARRLQGVGKGLARLVGGGAAVLARCIPGVRGHPAAGIRTVMRGLGFISAAVGEHPEEYRRAGDRVR